MTNTNAFSKVEQQLVKENQIYMVGGNGGVMDGIAQSHTLRGVMGVVLLSTSANVVAAGVKNMQDTEQTQAPQGYSQQGESQSVADHMGDNVIDHGDGEFTIVAMKAVGQEPSVELHNGPEMNADMYEQNRNMDNIDYIQNKMQEHQTADSIFLFNNSSYFRGQALKSNIDSNSVVSYDSRAISNDIQAKFPDFSAADAKYVTVTLKNNLNQHGLTAFAQKFGDKCTFVPILDSMTGEQDVSWVKKLTDFEVPQTIAQDIEKHIANEELAHCQDNMQHAENIKKYESGELLRSIRMERYGQLKASLETVRDLGNIDTAKYYGAQLKIFPVINGEDSLDHSVGNLYDNALPEIETMLNSGKLQQLSEAERDAWTLEQVVKSMELEGLTAETVVAQQNALNDLKTHLSGHSLKDVREMLSQIDVDPSIEIYTQGFIDGYDTLGEIHEKYLTQDQELSKEAAYQQYLDQEVNSRSPQEAEYFMKRELRNIDASIAHKEFQINSPDQIQDQDNAIEELEEYNAQKYIVMTSYEQLKAKNPEQDLSAKEMDLSIEAGLEDLMNM